MPHMSCLYEGVEPGLRGLSDPGVAIVSAYFRAKLCSQVCLNLGNFKMCRLAGQF